MRAAGGWECEVGEESSWALKTKGGDWCCSRRRKPWIKREKIDFGSSRRTEVMLNDGQRPLVLSPYSNRAYDLLWWIEFSLVSLVRRVKSYSHHLNPHSISPFNLLGNRQARRDALTFQQENFILNQCTDGTVENIVRGQGEFRKE